MPLYEIPCLMRYVKLDPQTMHSRVVCLHIDNVGLFVYYDKEEQLDPAYIRRHLIGRTDVRCLIEADNVEEAIKKFFNEYKGLLIGGEEEEARALWINREKEILELPFCAQMHKNKKGRFICGEEEGENGNGEFGMCMLEGYDAPDKCVVAEFYGNFHKMKVQNTINGYKVVFSAF